MAGGTFIAQNKVRPGAYFNFKGVAKPLSKIGTRGIMTMPVAMGWGAAITTLLSTDLLDGKSLAKIGYTAFDAESQIYRAALSNCYKAIIHRLDEGGAKATKAYAPLTMTAQYAGILGNDISVKVIANGAKFDVITYFKGSQKDKQTVLTVEELEPNDWVVPSGTGNLVANAGSNLAGGTNGVVADANYANYLNAIKAHKFDCMAIPQDITPAVATSIIAFITTLRENNGKKTQVVLFDVDADYEGVITTIQGFKTADETFAPTTFAAYVAGLTAGSNINQSNTYHVVDGAIEITYPDGVTPYGDDEIIAALQAGKFILSTRQDGTIIVEQDINSLHTFTPEKGYAFSKNRVIRTLDEINNTLTLLWETSYGGKVDNNEYGRSLYKGDCIAYFNKLQSMSAIQNFDSTADISVYAGEAIDAVVADYAAEPVDAMEKLYGTVLVG